MHQSSQETFKYASKDFLGFLFVTILDSQST